MNTQTLDLDVLQPQLQPQVQDQHQHTLQTQVAEQTQEKPARFRGFIAGITSGVTKLCVGHPFDTVKVRLQTSGNNGRFHGAIHCLMATIRKEGFFALYKGATPPLIGWMFMDSITLGSLHNFRLFLKGNDPSAQLNLFQHALAGFGSGMVVSCIATPVEHIKAIINTAARLQIQYDATTKTYTGPIDCAQKLIRNNGVFGLWKGMGGTLLHRSWFSVLWSSYELYSSYLRKTGLSEPIINGLAGGMAANTFWLCAYPFDVVKNRIMTQPDIKPLQHPSWIKCFKHLYITEGFYGFYRGFMPCLLRSFPTNAAAIAVWEATMRSLKAIGY
ncbi:5405_t:CDS:10 [Paraglomus brasilianum]|uniref:5405_t:CDS:1 n=1 Tax=Paraglomus brasilianum TaxID=144538 RepID=A0A9N8ZDS4_9GLOM|nr:5405_t:CDS:10 [Paraglomus brasilianum]